MKHVTALVSAFLSVWLAPSFVTAEKPQSVSHEHHPRYSQEHMRVLQRMDKNGDGILEPKEIPKAAAAYVQELAAETGHDSRKPIQLKELTAKFTKKKDKIAAGKQRQSWHAEHAKVLRRLDRDRDGLLEPEEIPPEAKDYVAHTAKEAGFKPGGPLPLAKLFAAHRKRFKNLPHNHHDGSAFTPNEKLTPESAVQYAATLIHLYDDNGDEILEKAEWHDLHKEWGTADGNKDGKLTCKEVATALMSISRSPSK